MGRSAPAFKLSDYQKVAWSPPWEAQKQGEGCYSLTNPIHGNKGNSYQNISSKVAKPMAPRRKTKGPNLRLRAIAVPNIMSRIQEAMPKSYFPSLGTSDNISVFLPYPYPEQGTSGDTRYNAAVGQTPVSRMESNDHYSGNGYPSIGSASKSTTDLPGQYNDDGPADFMAIFVLEESPGMSLGLLRTIPLPGSLEVIQKLHEAWKQAFLDGQRSLADWHSFRKGHYSYPPWIISLWLKLYKPVSSCLAWAASKSFLTNVAQNGSTETQCLAMRALNTFHQITWDGDFHTILRRELFSKTDVTVLLSHRMLPQAVINALLFILREELNKAPEHCSYICSTDLMDKLRQKKIGKLADSFLSKEIRHVFIPIYFPPLHWSLFWIDLSTKSLRYGDSTDQEASTTDIQLIQHWLSVHGITIKFSGSFMIGKQTDGHSCGLAVVNGVEHALLDTQLWSQETADSVRIGKYLDIWVFEGALEQKSLNKSPTPPSALSLPEESHASSSPQEKHVQTKISISSKVRSLSKLSSQHKIQLDLRTKDNEKSTGLFSYSKKIKHEERQQINHANYVESSESRKEYREKLSMEAVAKEAHIRKLAKE
ncbi:hypothetical protein M422DRAFT_255654 [Sphaerobolus stellatus SS14]|uniref:Ubiquitin-like protease family profile domain-containing protein n=1 Tax=Sphaerobolus stellatus (strain SS14) TaxID=990650 RepID=A0A0C9VTK8_SPHS4|nr:hypothetical protein M422DRAFT_255654 [Sphaerobolus stellatus SS14]